MIEMIYQKYGGLMYHIARKVLGYSDLTHDIVQDSLLYLMINIEKIENYHENKLKNYICLLTKHRAIEIIRKSKKIISLEEVDIDIYDERNLENEIIQDIEIKNIITAIQTLPSIERDILELSLLYEYRPSEIAEFMGWNGAQSRKRLQRAREKLRSLL